MVHKLVSRTMCWVPAAVLCAVLLPDQASANAYDNAIPIRLGGGRIMMVLKDYKFDINAGETYLELPSETACQCRLLCSIAPKCYTAMFGLQERLCVISDQPKAFKSARGYQWYFMSPFRVQADGLFYFFLGGALNFDNAISACNTFGARMAIARSKITFEILRNLHVTNAMMTAWINLFQTANNIDLHWHLDGSKFNSSLLEAGDRVLDKVPGDTGYLFEEGMLKFSSAPSTDSHSVICQVNYFGAVW